MATFPFGSVMVVSRPALSYPEIQDVPVAFAGWMAQQESARRSERIKAGLARRKAAGLAVCRQPGVPLPVATAVRGGLPVLASGSPSASRIAT